MPGPGRESQPPEDIATQIVTGAWLVAASGGLGTARSGERLRDTERTALTALRDALRSAADHQSIVAISGQLGLASAREATHLIEAVGAETVPALNEMANVVSRASEEILEPTDDDSVDRVRRLLLALSELRLAQARNLGRSDPEESWWPTTLSSSS
jgi:hypothetical protein